MRSSASDPARVVRVVSTRTPPSMPGPSGWLGGRSGGLGFGRGVVAESAGGLGRAADRRGKEHPAAGAAVSPRRTVAVNANRAAPRHKERTPLVEERLVGRQIQDRGIALYLSEVRVEGGVERQVARHAILEVAAQRHIRLAADCACYRARTGLLDPDLRVLLAP